jgi:hypothetical protein
MPDIDVPDAPEALSGAQEDAPGVAGDSGAEPAPEAQKQTDETLTQESDSVDSDIPEL